MDTKNKIIKVNAIIIYEADYKEYDKLLTLLTDTLGVISVYAFNVRKPNSKNIGMIRLFSFGEYELREINDKYQLDNAKLLKDFTDMASDYDSNCYASYFIELANYFSVDNIDTSDVYLLIYYTFKAMEEKKVNLKLIRRIFELKMLKYQGLYKESDKLMSDNATLKYTWDFILKSVIDKLYTFKLSDEIFNLFDTEMSIEMRSKVNKKFKTLNFIEAKC